MNADDVAALLTLVLTLLPGTHPVVGRDIARQALERAGCKESVVVIQPGTVPRTFEVRARCIKLPELERPAP